MEKSSGCKVCRRLAQTNIHPNIVRSAKKFISKKGTMTPLQRSRLSAYINLILPKWSKATKKNVIGCAICSKLDPENEAIYRKQFRKHSRIHIHGKMGRRIEKAIAAHPRIVKNPGKYKDKQKQLLVSQVEDQANYDANKIANEAKDNNIGGPENDKAETT